MRPTDFEKPTPETIARHYRIAEALIAEEAAARTGTLDLTLLHLPELPPGFREMGHLREVWFGLDEARLDEYTDDRFCLSDPSDWGRVLPRVAVVRLAACDIGDLSFAPGFVDLRHLDCSQTDVEDLGPLAGLSALRYLNCSWTQVADLGPLAGLSALQHLNCSQTEVTDLSPVAELSALQHLDVSSTEVLDLDPVAGLSALQHLNCSHTQVTDLGPVAGLSALRHLDLNYTTVSDLGPIAGLLKLEYLRSVCDVADLSPLAGLSALRELHCHNSEITDLGPLAGLSALQRLDCSNTQIADLCPLAGLSALRELRCSETRVADLGPLAGLVSLRELDCSETPVADLSPLAGLTALENLVFTGTQVADLGPVSALVALKVLYCSLTPVADLGPVSRLVALKTLDCSDTQVADLGPLSRLSALRHLDCTQTPVADLSPLSGLPKLEELYCSGTQVSDLSPILPTNTLEKLYANFCPISHFLPEWLESPTLRFLILGPKIPGFPDELFSDQLKCLSALRAHFADLAAGREPDRTVKLVVLGNGRIGKTQLCRHIRGLGFDPYSDSTHGVQVFTAELGPEVEAEVGNSDEKLTLNLWDFGGQELYHGTHTLFVGGAAIFVILWTPESEARPEVEEADGMKFRNHPLAYWLNYIRYAGGRGPVLLVQGFCDDADGYAPAPAPAEMLDGLPFVRELQFGAKQGRGLSAIKAAIAEASKVVQTLRGTVEIGKGRAAVRRWIADQRAPDGRFPHDRRMIDRQEFETVCAEAGGIGDVDLFLEFLHQSGLVFRRPGHFGDAIVLDQQWLLSGIYSLLDRKGVMRVLQSTNGIFDRSLLHFLHWDHAGYSVEEQDLFLSMMTNSGLCFQLDWHFAWSERIYVAPEMLPDESAVAEALTVRWPQAAVPDRRTVWTFPLLHPGMIRAVIARIGLDAGRRALYWRQGVCLYEARSRARAIVRAIPDPPPAYGGRIELLVKDGDAAVLEAMLTGIIEDRRSRLGLDAACERAEPRPAGLARTPHPDYVPDPALPPIDAYVSHAWSDDSPEGRERTERIEALMATAAVRGKNVQRDLDELRFGDRVTPYMQRLGKGQRIYLMLGDKYLKSAACVFELYEIWENCLRDTTKFRGRVNLFQLPGLPHLSNPNNLAAYAAYWNAKIDEDAAVLRDIGPQAMTPLDIIRYHQAMRFRDNLPEVLALIADTPAPRDWTDFLADGFREI